MAYLIDTDTIIYSLKNDKNVQAKFKENEQIPKCISIISYWELLYSVCPQSRLLCGQTLHLHTQMRFLR